MNATNYDDMNFEKEKDGFLKEYVKKTLAEDVREGDHTSLACIDPNATDKAKLLVKDVGVLAGVEVAKYFFKEVDPDSKIDIYIEDGSDVKYGDIAFEVTCNSQALLKVERSMLNTMQRMSGVASFANRFAFEVGGLPVKVLDTRKTTPLLRFLEKWAVRLGGCTNYRNGLYDWIMIKDNHIDACGGIQQAIERVAQYQKDKGLNLNVTVEVRNLNELDEVLAVGGVTRIMLDNFEVPLLRAAVEIIGDRFETEASGGVNINTVRAIAKTGVDFVSVGALTHSVQSLDMSLKVVK